MPGRKFRTLFPLFLLVLPVLVSAQFIRRVPRRSYSYDHVSGKLLEVGTNSLLLDVKGEKVTVTVGSDTTVHVRAPGDPKYLKPGAMVEVQGTATASDTIADARMTVYLAEGPTISRYGRTYRAEAKSPDAIPVVLIAQVVQLDPLIVEASNSVASEYYTPADKGPDGQPLRTHLFPTTGKPFLVRLAERRGKGPSLLLDVGSAIKLAGEDATVDAMVGPPNNLAQSVFVFRREPFTDAELGLEEPRGGEKKPGKTPRKAKTRKPRGKPTQKSVEPSNPEPDPSSGGE